PLRRARLARVLGMTIDDADISRILEALGLSVETAADGWLVTPPSRRFDLAIEEDLIEEVARIHGYDSIPVRLPAGAAPLQVPSETRVGEGTVRRHLASRGFLEAINYAFVDRAMLADWA
ncbi:phenylalanine--tRNA ligase subunit beta, partial [Lysobacter sp. D1-1-M9]